MIPALETVTKRLRANRDAIVTAYTGGQTTRQLAASYGTSKTTMTHFLKVLCGVRMRSNGDWVMSAPLLSQEKEKEILDRYVSGYPMWMVADHYNLPESHVLSVLRRYERPVGRGTWAPIVKVPTDAGMLGYVAGIVDGEGSIVLEANGRAAVQIANTSVRLIESLRRRLGGSVYWHARRDRKVKQIGYWRAGRALDCLNLLVAIEPYLIIKRAKALKAIEVLRRKLGATRAVNARQSE